MFCWHKWGMWSVPKLANVMNGTEFMGVQSVQERGCSKCGKTQVKPIERK